MTGTPGWDGILDAGETILWQGRPDGAVTFQPRSIPMLLLGLFVAGFALFWMVMAAWAGGLFWLFGLLHFSVGIEIAFATTFWSAFKRRRSWYTLTDRRAFLATHLPWQGKRLKSWPIDAGAALELVSGPPDTVYFAETARSGKKAGNPVPVGFERIPDGRQVYRLMRDIQTRDRDPGTMPAPPERT